MIHLNRTVGDRLIGDLVSGMQVTHMWSSRLNSMKIMYFINKYSVFLDAGLAVHSTFLSLAPGADD